MSINYSSPNIYIDSKFDEKTNKTIITTVEKINNKNINIVKTTTKTITGNLYGNKRFESKKYYPNTI